MEKQLHSFRPPLFGFMPKLRKRMLIFHQQKKNAQVSQNCKLIALRPLKYFAFFFLSITMKINNRGRTKKCHNKIRNRFFLSIWPDTFIVMSSSAKTSGRQIAAHMIGKVCGETFSFIDFVAPTKEDISLGNSRIEFTLQYFFDFLKY